MFNLQVIRHASLITSITIVLISLVAYSYNTIPISTLIHQDSLVLSSEMVQDRRLIATLVAAQASIFCPLLRRDVNERDSLADLVCQFLMPVGLALSWFFCITFESKTDATLMAEGLFAPTKGMFDWANILYTMKVGLIALLLAEAISVYLSITKEILEDDRQDNACQLPVYAPVNTTFPVSEKS